MAKRLQDTIAAHLVAKGIQRDNEINTYIISFVAIVFCLLVHIYLLCVFAVHRMTLFTVINCASTAVYASMIWFHKKRRYTAIGLIITIDVTLYATAFILTVGLSTYIAGYYLLACILQATLPYGTSRMRLTMLGVVTVVGLVAMLISMNVPPQVVLTEALDEFLTLSNIYIIFIGTMAQLYIGNMIGSIIARLNELKLEEMSLLANTDTLTGLYNRRYAEMLFAKLAQDDDSECCVAMLDIDDFKQVNDTWGHPCGDEVLVFLAQFVRDALRRTDVVFRWGGEEFLMLLYDVDPTTAFVILDKLREKLAGSVIHTAATDLRVTVTIGVAVFDPKRPEQSVKLSDDRLYIGKTQGKNVVIV